MSKNGFGDLNPRSTDTRYRKLTNETSGVKGILDGAIQSNNTIKDSLKSKGMYMAEVLKVFNNPADQKTTKSSSGFNLWGSVESRPDDVVTIIARIPEIHHFCLPENLPLSVSVENDTYEQDAKIIDMYPRFVAAAPNILVPKVGQKVWVTFEDKINYSGGIYVGIVDENEVVAPSAATKKRKSPKKAVKKAKKPIPKEVKETDPKPTPPAVPPKPPTVPPPTPKPRVLKPGDPIPGEGYHKTVTAWNNALSSTGQIGKTWIGPIEDNGTPDSKHENGRRDNIIFVPNKFNKSKPAEMILWWHGNWGFWERSFEMRILRHINDLYADGRNVFIVIPECPWSRLASTPVAGTPFNRGKNPRGIPSSPGQFTNYINTVFQILLNNMDIDVAAIPGGFATVIGHSRGGDAIRAIAKAPQNEKGQPFESGLSILNVKTIIYSDSNYGSWIQQTYENFVKDSVGVHMYMITQAHLKTPVIAASFVKRKKPKHVSWLWMPPPWKHMMIGDNSIRYPYGLIATGDPTGGVFHRDNKKHTIPWSKMKLKPHRTRRLKKPVVKYHKD
jgi:hypothetical protein